MEPIAPVTRQDPAESPENTQESPQFTEVAGTLGVGGTYSARFHTLAGCFGPAGLAVEPGPYVSRAQFDFYDAPLREATARRLLAGLLEASGFVEGVRWTIREGHLVMLSCTHVTLTPRDP